MEPMNHYLEHLVGIQRRAELDAGMENEVEGRAGFVSFCRLEHTVRRRKMSQRSISMSMAT